MSPAEAVSLPADVPTGVPWRPVTRTEAEARVGFHVFRVPDLTVTLVQVAGGEDSPVVRVVQELEAGGGLELVQARSEEALDLGPVPQGAVRASVRRDDVVIVATAPLSAQALETLLERLR